MGDYVSCRIEIVSDSGGIENKTATNEEPEVVWVVVTSRYGPIRVK